MPVLADSQEHGACNWDVLDVVFQLVGVQRRVTIYHILGRRKGDPFRQSEVNDGRAKAAPFDRS
jgi:hypothetical protein